MSSVLLIDNYDSFVYNLARYFQRLGQTTDVVRCDAIDVDEVRRRNPRAVVLSPGPCTPVEAGCSLEIVRQLTGIIPILGVCLGHQAIAAGLGATIVRAPNPVHGGASPIWHDGRDIFTGLPNPLRVGRYHSLIADETTLPACLEVSARTDDGLIMGLRHREAPVAGLQFHPESILTEHGYDLLWGFLRLAGVAEGVLPPSGYEERRTVPMAAWQPPAAPHTFYY